MKKHDFVFKAYNDLIKGYKEDLKTIARMMKYNNKINNADVKRNFEELLVQSFTSLGNRIKDMEEIGDILFDEDERAVKK